MARPLAGPHPLPAVVRPPLADERHHEPVPVHREVVAEPALHAGRPLIGRVLLDGGRGDPHDLVALDVDVELAADAAVGADAADDLVGVADGLGAEALLGDELEDGTGGADADALAAPSAAGVVRIAVAADDDLRVLAPHAYVEHADLLNIFAGPHAAGAKDTGAHVVLDHHVARPLVTFAERKLVVVAQGDVVIHDVALELVSRMGAAAVRQMVARIALEQEAEHAPPVLHRRRGLGLHHHAIGGRRGAGGHQLALSLYRDEADPTVADDGELGVPAERRDVDTGRSRRLENGGARIEGDSGAVQRKSRHASQFCGRRGVI